jgi:hypothetical protein
MMATMVLALSHFGLIDLDRYARPTNNNFISV